MKNKFDSAHEVQQKKKRGRRMLMPKFERFKPHTDTDLVYLKTSPDYCEFDVKKGSLGTHGRECDHVSGKEREPLKKHSVTMIFFCLAEESWDRRMRANVLHARLHDAKNQKGGTLQVQVSLVLLCQM